MVVRDPRTGAVPPDLAARATVLGFAALAAVGIGVAAVGLIAGNGHRRARARYYTLTQGTFSAAEAKEWGAVAEVLPQDQVLSRAQELAEGLAAKPQLLTRYIAVTLRQRISRRMAEGTLVGMALESLTAANLAYLSQPQ